MKNNPNFEFGVSFSTLKAWDHTLTLTLTKKVRVIYQKIDNIFNITYSKLGLFSKKDFRKKIWVRFKVWSHAFSVEKLTPNSKLGLFFKKNFFEKKIRIRVKGWSHSFSMEKTHTKGVSFLGPHLNPNPNFFFEKFLEQYSDNLGVYKQKSV